MLRKFIWVGLGWLAAAGLFMSVINRVLSYLRRRHLKSVFSFSLLAFLASVFGWLGWGGGKRGRQGIGLTLAVLGLGEMRYRWSDLALRGSPPVNRAGRSQSLFRPVTTTDLNVYRYALRLSGCDGVSPAMAATQPRLRIVQLSDLHLNHKIPPSYYRDVVERIYAFQPDLIFITGDFVTETEGICQFPALADKLKSRLGTYAIFGNHDYWADPDEVRQVVAAAGVELIGNGFCRIRDADLNLLIQGCEEPWSHDRLALAEAQPDELALVLSHSADHIYRFSDYGAAAVFTGHYHAGQFQIPQFGPLFIPSKFGRRFHHGHYVVDGTHLFVSAGVGASHPALRLYCPPDVFVVDFYA